MNRKMIFGTIGQIVKLEAALLLLPLSVALAYGESSALAFLITIGVALVVGFALSIPCRTDNHVIFAREGFVTVAFAWVALSAIGALPFVISGEIPFYVDAFFETVSGFTTTGASIVTNVESMSHGILFWRSFTHWIGGMGVLVLIMAILPTGSGRSIHILRAEMAGPIVGKIVPKVRDTAKILYLLYLALTVLETVFLLAGGMPVFDSVVHALGTAGTGGFGIKANSIAGYSPYLQWVITIFMLLFGVNFNLYYLLLIRRVRPVLKNTELRCYGALLVVCTVVIMVNIYPLYHTFADSLRESAFQVASIVTTTGYATADFNQWPGLSKGILFLLMFVGACAGSTAGGLKISRVMLLFKSMRRELRRMLHPRSVGAVQMEGKTVDDTTLNGVSVYFALYFAIFAVVFLILCLEPFDLETNITATASCLNNIGPGLGAVGPASSYAGYSALSKIVLSIAMLFGRLEIYPLLLTMSPSIWAKK